MVNTLELANSGFFVNRYKVEKSLILCYSSVEGLMKKKCPNCSSAEFVVPIRYGMPGPGMQQKYYEGEIKLGGCCMAEEMPNWHCKKCEHDY